MRTSLSEIAISAAQAAQTAREELKTVPVWPIVPSRGNIGAAEAGDQTFLEQTILRYVWLYNQQLPQSVLDSRTPLQAMKDWHKLNPELFKKIPYQLTGCDS